jgi:autotransporter-associated beta strand protein
LNGGTIQFNDGSSIGSGVLTIQNGTVVNNYAAGDYLNLANALVVPAGATATIDMGNAIDLTGNLTGAGTLNLNVQNTGATDEIKGNFGTFTGTINLLGSGGVILVANGGAFYGFADALTTINAPVTLGFHDNSGGNTYTFGALSGNNPNAAFYDQYAGAPTVSIGALNLSTTFAGQFQSSVNVTKTGTGTLTLSGNSTHTGTTTVSSGILAVTGSFSSSPVTVNSGAILEGTGILGNGVTIQSGGSLEPDLGGISFGTLTVSNSLNLNTSQLIFDLSSSPAAANDEILLPGGTLNESGTQTYNLNLVNNALGAGTYTLIGGAAANNFGGSLVTDLPTNTRQGFSLQNTLTGVQLAVTGNASSLVWQGTNGGNWDVATTVNWLNGAVADEFYNLDVVQFDDTATNGNVNINGVVQPAGVLVTNSATVYTIGGGVLGGITSLVKTGPGSLTLNSSNSYTGGTYVNGGTLQLVSNPYAAGFGPINLNGGTLYLNGVGTGTTITSTGTNFLVTYGQPYANFNLQGSGLLTVTLGGGTFSPSGDWSGFSGTINFTTGNWLRELNTTTFGSAAAVWNFGVNGGINNKYGGATVSFGALFGGSATALAGPSTAPANPTTYVVGGINTNSVFNGTISDGASPTALIFNGPGSLTLTGNNTFSGNTTVNGGALIINSASGSGTGSGTVTINGGATLGGNGIIGGQVSLAAGATLAPGSNGSGTLTITNDLGLNNASILQFRLGTTGSQAAVTGDLTLAGSLNISAAAGFGPGKYPLFTYGGTLSVGTLTFGSLAVGYNYTLDTSVLGQVNLVVASPNFAGIRATGSGLVFSGSGGTTNAVFYLLTSTNLATPLAGWTRVLTNQFDVNGNFNFTNPLNAHSPQGFYRLQMP